MKKNIFLIYIAAAALLCTVSCTKLEIAEVPPGHIVPGDKVTVFLPMKVATLEQVSKDGTPISRAPLESEGMDTESISNVWIFQFGEAATDDKRLLVSPPYYLDEATIQKAIDDWNQKGGTSYTKYPHIPIPLLESAPGEVHLVVFAANINSKDFNWSMSAVEGQKSSYATLKKNVFLLDGESLSYGGNYKNLLMSGRIYSPITPNIVLDENPDNPGQGGNNDEEGVSMYRSLARIGLNLSVDESVDFKVLSVQLRNIPQRIDIFDALIARDENLYTDYSIVYPEMPAELIDYDAIYNENDKTIGLISSGESSEYVWYIPRNMRGQSASNSPKTKNVLAPQGATYIEVVGTNGERNNEGVIYRIYPGLNDINDHTILGNHLYNITLNIKGGDEELMNDGRVEQYSHIRLDGNNNSFIINPPMLGGMGSRVFEIPITQVNRYWRQSWDGYGGINENIIKSNDEWQVDLLWQEDAGIVRLTKDIDTRIWLSKNEGRGADSDGYFSITVPYGAIHGNFSIALRKKEAGNVLDQVLWSWHFWVTDYNPDEHKNKIVQGRKFVYPVTGGQVERHGGTLWGYDTKDSQFKNNWNNYEYNEASTQPYAKAFIMDRNLGAPHTNYLSTTSKGNITFQFGRKDPFPSNINLYDINGTAITTTSKTGFQAQRWDGRTANALSSDTQVTMIDATSDPMKFYHTKGAWNVELDGTDKYAWNDPMISTGSSSDKKGYAGKSIYDPCPPGWKLPARHTWEDFRRDNTYGWTLNNGSHNRGDGFGSFNKGMRYWPNVLTQDGGYPVEGTISFSASGYRWSNYFSSAGQLYRDGTDGIIWSAISSSPNSGYSMSFSTTSISTSYDNTKANGASVRCISISE